VFSRFFSLFLTLYNSPAAFGALHTQPAATSSQRKTEQDNANHVE